MTSVFGQCVINFKTRRRTQSYVTAFTVIARIFGQLLSALSSARTADLALTCRTLLLVCSRSNCGLSVINKRICMYECMECTWQSVFLSGVPVHHPPRRPLKVEPSTPENYSKAYNTFTASIRTFSVCYSIDYARLGIYRVAQFLYA